MAPSAGQGPGQVADDAAARDVGTGVQAVAQRGARGQHGGGVDHRRPQQLVGHADVGPRPGRVVETQAGPLEQDVAGQGVAVGAQPGGGQPDDGVAGLHPLGTELGAVLDHPDREAGQVELVGGHDPGVLGRLAADQRAAGLTAALVHPGHDGGHRVRIDLAGGQVVEHEERLGTDAHQVVHAHGHQVEADRLVAAGGRATTSLVPTPSVEATSTGRVAGHVERELAAEAADARHHGAQPLDRGVAGRDVHAGRRVGGAALVTCSDPGERGLVRRIDTGRPRKVTGVAAGPSSGSRR